MKFYFTLLFFVFLSAGNAVMAQNVISLTDDTVYDETVIITENTIIEGVGFPTVQFNGSPKFKVEGATLLLKNMRIPNKRNWGTIEDGMLEWYSIGMKGHITDNVPVPTSRLDGSTRD